MPSSGPGPNENVREDEEMRCLKILVAFVVFLSVLPAAQAAAGRETRERAAKKACLSGDPLKGAEILADLYIDTNDVTYIFNQGRCFEQNHRYEDAISRFREYLIKGKNLSSDEKADAEAHIATCQSYLVKPDAPPVESPSGERPVLTAPPPTAPESNRAGAELAVSEQPPVVSGRAGAKLRIAGVVTASIGVAAVVSGVILNLKVNSMTGDLEKQYDRSRNSTRENYKTLGWIGYSAGATCVATGAVLYYLGWRRERESRASVSLLPMPGMPGAILTGVF
jgi:hypothetical protein